MSNNIVKFAYGVLGVLISKSAKYPNYIIIGGNLMNIYTTDKIRNVVLLGHAGSGKTSLVEAMAYLSGITSRMGKTADGNTLSDFTKEEQKRQFSIGTSVIPIEWEGYKINVLDTPGMFDFVGEVEEAICAAGAAIIVVNGKSGIEVGTLKAWELCEKYKLPRIIYVSNMDVDNASFRQVVEDMTAQFGKKMAPFHLPIREDEKFVGYVNVISETASRWVGKDVVACDVPEYNKANLEICRDTLLESVAETSEEFMERYFGGETFSEAEIRAALRVNVCDGSIVPMSMGSNVLCQGIYTLLDDIVKYFPSPENKECKGISLKTNEIFEAEYNAFDSDNEEVSFVASEIEALDSDFAKVISAEELSAASGRFIAENKDMFI